MEKKEKKNKNKKMSGRIASKCYIYAYLPPLTYLFVSQVRSR